MPETDGVRAVSSSRVKLPSNLWPVVASVCGSGWPPPSAAAAATFVRQCATEGLLALLFDSADLPEPVGQALRSWRAFDAAARHRAGVVRRTIGRLPDLLGSDFALIKGSDVAFRLYSAPHLRPMTDVDVLIPRSAMSGVVERMAGQGYRPHHLKPSQSSPRNPDLAFDLGDGTLEVHHSLVHRSSAAIDYEELWAHRVPTRIDQVEAWRLSDADALIATALSIAKDGLTGPLIRYVDVWLAVTSNPGIVEEAIRQARRWRIRNAVHSVLRGASRFFPDLPADIPRRPWLERRVIPPGSGHRRDFESVPTMERLWRRYWMIDGLDQRLQYLTDIAAAAAVGFLRRGSGAVDRT